MKKLLGLGSIALLLFAVSGCGANADSLVQEQIKEMNDLAQAMETNAPDSTIKDIQKKMEDTNQKLKDLKVSDEEGKKLADKYKDDLTKALQRLLKAAMTKGMKDMGSQFPGMPAMPAGADNVPTKPNP